jgi:hypothetical protein
MSQIGEWNPWTKVRSPLSDDNDDDALESNEEARLIRDCKDKPFLEFNDIIGLPKKDNKPLPIFDYEIDILNKLSEHRNLWILKATGLGITELILRVMAWLCLSSNKYKGQRMDIVTGPRIQQAIELIDRIKTLFLDSYPGLFFETNMVTAVLNSVKIQAFPSATLDTMRSYKDVCFVFVDEGDFFPKAQQRQVRPNVERYRIKSNPFIVMVSTPNAPGGLFEQMEREEESKYHRMKLDYTYGLGKLYDPVFLEQEKKEEYFEREYNLKYLGKVGNVFNYQDIEASVQDFSLSLNVNEEAQSMGIDPGFGGSAFGIVITTYRDGKIHILLADEFERPSYEEMLDKCWKLIKAFKIRKVYVDGSNPAFIKSLKTILGERSNYDTVPKEHYRFMKVVPVNFGTRHREMLSHAKTLIENDFMRIHSNQNKLSIALKTAWEDNGALSKEETSYDDLFDAFRLSLLAYKQGEPQQT